MTKEEFVECAIKLFGLWNLVLNASGSALQILANGLDMKYRSYSSAYYFMFFVSQVLIGWALLVNSKRIARWLFSFDTPGKANDEEF